MNTITISTGGTSQVVEVGAVSTASTAVKIPGSGIITPTINVYCRRGPDSPVALADGTDQMMEGGKSHRVGGLQYGDKIAFIAASPGAEGFVYITEGA